LSRVKVFRTVIACITNAVVVPVLLVYVFDEDTIVLIVTNAVSVGVVLFVTEAAGIAGILTTVIVEGAL